MFSMLPLSAALLACMLSIVPDAGWGRWLRTGVAALLAVSAIMSAPGYLKDSYAEMFLPDDASSGMLDVKQRPVGGHLYNLAFFRVADVDEVVGISMRYRVVHGLAAVIVGESFGGVRTNMDARARNALPVLGGMAAADNRVGEEPLQKNVHIAGFTQEAWRNIGRVPTFSNGRLGWIQPAQIINPGVGHVVAHPGSPRHFIARQPFTSTAKFALDFAAACDQVVAVTNIMRPYAAAPTVNATANGTAIAPRFQDTATYFFDVPACISGEIVSWQLTIIGVRETVDVVTF